MAGVEGPGYWPLRDRIRDLPARQPGDGARTDLGFGATLDWRIRLFRLHAAGPSGSSSTSRTEREKHSGGYWLFWLAKRYPPPVDTSIELHRGKVHPMDSCGSMTTSAIPFGLRPPMVSPRPGRDAARRLGPQRQPISGSRVAKRFVPARALRSRELVFSTPPVSGGRGTRAATITAFPGAISSRR